MVGSATYTPLVAKGGGQRYILGWLHTVSQLQPTKKPRAAKQRALEALLSRTQAPFL